MNGRTETISLSRTTPMCCILVNRQVTMVIDFSFACMAYDVRLLLLLFLLLLLLISTNMIHIYCHNTIHVLYVNYTSSRR